MYPILLLTTDMPTLCWSCDAPAAWPTAMPTLLQRQAPWPLSTSQHISLQDTPCQHTFLQSRRRLC
jgi:hypothetical protein